MYQVWITDNEGVEILYARTANFTLALIEVKTMLMKKEIIGFHIEEELCEKR